MLRCITVDRETLIASHCDRNTTKELSKEKQLLCPNCQSTVIFKAGKVKRSHFAHYDSECVITNYEPETPSHLQGKQVLYEWLNKKYPNADVKYEVYIPETNQIADILVEHREEEMKGLRWAFEFQHSSLSSTDWETRHELYKSAGIQDFWVLDRAKYMKFSTAQGITDARKRNELEKTIFSKTGLCYFLDLESSELTIDFKFTTSWQTTIVSGFKRKNSYTYHSPIHHSAPIDQVRVRINDEFKYGVLVYSEIEDHMKDRLSYILSWFIKERARKAKEELQVRAKEKKAFAKKKYDEEKAAFIWRFMEQNIKELDDDEEMYLSINENRGDLTENVRNLSAEEFFTIYKSLFDKLQQNIVDFKRLRNSEELEHRLLGKLIYESTLYSLSFLKEQRSRSLEDYLKTIYEEKIDIVTYVYKTYKKDLEKLASMNFKAIKRSLDNIIPIITPWESNPTAIDYAINYERLKSKEAADEHIKKIKEQIIYYNPFADMEDW